MSLRDELAGVLARDPRYSIHAYAFIFEAIEHTKSLKKRAQAKSRGRRPTRSRHVTGRELCEGARLLALSHYGLLAKAVLNQWGIRSTSDLGEIVFNLIASGDLEKSPTDSRGDFDHVFDFEEALRRDFVLALDDVA
ncbi:Minf_1886 family protein [Tundrisphaera lichenicola]|uniref:Minf_1886 family protein n=1 Tax=Tundrisphaera lichenicola TaxID=2029860 RepID=UPI003EB6A826